MRSVCFSKRCTRNLNSRSNRFQAQGRGKSHAVRLPTGGGGGCLPNAGFRYDVINGSKRSHHSAPVTNTASGTGHTHSELLSCCACWLLSLGVFLLCVWAVLCCC